MENDMVTDSFVLTFKDNSEPCITAEQVGDGYRIVPAQWLHDATKGTAEYLCKDDEGINIIIPIGVFLEIKNDHYFQSKCTTLVRLRTTPRTLLGSLLWPIKAIDNKVTK